MEDVSLKRKKDLLAVANRLAAFFISKSDFDKTVAYRVVTHHYQAVLMKASKSIMRIRGFSLVNNSNFPHQ